MKESERSLKKENEIITLLATLKKTEKALEQYFPDIYEIVILLKITTPFSFVSLACFVVKYYKGTGAMTRNRFIRKMGEGFGFLIFCGCASCRIPKRASVKLYAVKYGKSLYPLEKLVKGAEKEKRVPIAWMFYVVKAGKDVILVDTGFSDPEEAKHNGVTFLPYQPELAGLGITPESVTKIVLTHTHSDHAANVSLYPNATVIVNQREKESKFLKKVSPEKLITFDKSHEVIPGMTVHLVGGHTQGSSYVDLKVGEKKYILAGDEAYLPENLEKLIPVGSYVDTGANLRFLKMAKNSGAEVLSFHDPSIVKSGCIRQIAP